MEKYPAPGQKIVATGTWLYDGTMPQHIEITSRPVELASSRYVDEELDEASAIPQTPDGFVYYVGVTRGGQFRTLDDAKAWADAQPWGPVQWVEASDADKEAC